MNEFLFLSVETEATVYHALLSLIILVVAGLFGGRLFEKFGIPRITGHLIAGMVVGPSVLNIVTTQDVVGLDIITNIALGFIAYGIGSEISFRHLRKAGPQLIIITLFQAFLAVFFVIVLLLAFGAPVWLALTLGAIATATAPGPIMMITKQYRTKGPLTKTLVPLVGLDDAVGIALFGIMLSIANSDLRGTSTGFMESLQLPIIEILLSIIIGTAIGFLMMFLVNLDKKESREYSQIINISGIVVAVTLANLGVFGVHLSIVLTPMMAGVIYANFIDTEKQVRTMQVVDAFDPFILVAFFTIAGAHLDLKMIVSTEDITVVMFGVLYIVGRTVGKIVGSYVGGKVTNAAPVVRKYLGIALLPQAGVAIGMANAADATLGGAEGLMVLTISLAAVVLYELFGPLGVKMALTRAKEINIK